MIRESLNGGADRDRNKDAVRSIPRGSKFQRDKNLKKSALAGDYRTTLESRVSEHIKSLRTMVIRQTPVPRVVDPKNLPVEEEPAPLAFLIPTSYEK